MPDKFYGSQAFLVATRRLGIYEAAVDVDDLAAEIKQSALALTAKFAVLQGYDALRTSDQVWFDTAVGLMAAIRLIGNAVRTTNNGYISVKNNDFTYNYAAPDAAEQQKWLDEYVEALGYIKVLRASRQTVADATSVFGVAGRTRTRESNGLYSLARQIESLLPSGWGGDRRGILGGSPIDAQVPNGFY